MSEHKHFKTESANSESNGATPQAIKPVKYLGSAKTSKGRSLLIFSSTSRQHVLVFPAECKIAEGMLIRITDLDMRVRRRLGC